MAANQHLALDSTDCEILRLLQQDGRMTTAELARAIHMSATSAADRLRRLTDHGVIRGYRAVVDQTALGYPLTAYIRLRCYTSTTLTDYEDFLAAQPQILEAHHITGDDCYLIRIAARSVADLEELSTALSTYGRVTTNIVFSSPVPDRSLTPVAAEPVSP
ncbi:Lrp/AsnC family transcriptional regulator [Actinocrispum wychmicini]|uniref:Lrp/AsnC family leucine-responsive transcriptional regulator n=1 Tax=Actinocrispum wychmicini TaxID=1213861 RepID=A0A4R2J983_9PSEU|nr:Lrp/AsnC family transcriptional regulator [Actinocrispum wychmicini]TCO54342.1 Lrp/AsnC family leucine-responsive transcriptional regulator [Actinocrispum wychmicini]